MHKALKIVLISIGAIFFIGVFTLMYIGANTPETFIYTKNEIPLKYRAQINSLSLLSDDEQIIYFYSDGLLNITDGLYMLTNEHLIIYVAEWDEPELIIQFSEIDYIDVEYDNSFLTDSYINIETEFGLMVEFPVSSEKGRDHEFFNYLKQKVEEAH
jgi:hypothetical protein